MQKGDNHQHKTCVWNLQSTLTASVWLQYQILNHDWNVSKQVFYVNFWWIPNTGIEALVSNNVLVNHFCIAAYLVENELVWIKIMDLESYESLVINSNYDQSSEDCLKKGPPRSIEIRGTFILKDVSMQVRWLPHRLMSYIRLSCLSGRKFNI